MKRRSKKGFTLAELLIVIAIIAVLIAIMFPVFGAQIDKARAAAELANVRARYSELVAAQMVGGTGNSFNDPVGTVTISFNELKEAVQEDETIITLDAAAPSSKGTTEATGMPSRTNNTDDYYLTVTYKEYYGSFKIDGDVSISFENGSSTT